jgi:hypothetical protein
MLFSSKSPIKSVESQNFHFVTTLHKTGGAFWQNSQSQMKNEKQCKAIVQVVAVIYRHCPGARQDDGHDFVSQRQLERSGFWQSHGMSSPLEFALNRKMFILCITYTSIMPDSVKLAGMTFYSILEHRRPVTLAGLRQ